MVYRVMFSDDLNYAKEGRLKKGGKKIAPVTRGAKGTQTTTKTVTRQILLIDVLPDKGPLPNRGVKAINLCCL